MTISEQTWYQKMKMLIEGAEQDINLAKIAPCVFAKDRYLNDLSTKINEIKVLHKLLAISENRVEITAEELSMYNGKNGKPAYVAVNGVVYDITGHAAWAAATHFGLTAGKDLTGAYASCHAGQTILSNLKVVGKLI